LRIVARFGKARDKLSHNDINHIMSMPNNKTTNLAA